MASDIATIRPSLRQKEWEARKSRIGLHLGEIGNFVLRKAKDMINDLRCIKEKELWREGGYTSFGNLLDRLVGVSQRQIYRLLKEDSETHKVLEINESLMTLCHNEESTEPAESEPPKQPEKPLNAPPETKQKGRKKKPEPEPIEAEFVEQPATEENLPMHTDASDVELAAATPRDGERRCPHCGGAL